MSEVKVIGKTKAGKELGYRVPEGQHLYQIAFKTGGELPDALKGGWNDIRQLTLAVESYINSSVAKKASK